MQCDFCEEEVLEGRFFDEPDPLNPDGVIQKFMCQTCIDKLQENNE